MHIYVMCIYVCNSISFMNLKVYLWKFSKLSSCRSSPYLFDIPTASYTFCFQKYIDTVFKVYLDKEYIFLLMPFVMDCQYIGNKKHQLL